MNAQLQFEVTNQHIKRTDTFKPVAKSKNYLYAEFNFTTDEWKNKEVTAIFTTDKSYEVLLNDNYTCLVPWEVIEEGTFYVSCFAGDLITVDKSRVTCYNTGYTDDLESSHAPTPSIYAQILEDLNDVKHNIDGGLFTDWRDE